MDEATKRAALIRAKARKFAQHVRDNPGLAFAVPEDVVEWLRDDEFPAFFEACKTFRITRRDDWKWEARI